MEAYCSANELDEMEIVHRKEIIPAELDWFNEPDNYDYRDIVLIYYDQPLVYIGKDIDNKENLYLCITCAIGIHMNFPDDKNINNDRTICFRITDEEKNQIFNFKKINLSKKLFFYGSSGFGHVDNTVVYSNQSEIRNKVKKLLDRINLIY